MGPTAVPVVITSDCFVDDANVVDVDGVDCMVGAAVSGDVVGIGDGVAIDVDVDGFTVGAGWDALSGL
jgi:hypothetical protein